MCRSVTHFTIDDRKSASIGGSIPTEEYVEKKLAIDMDTSSQQEADKIDTRVEISSSKDDSTFTSGDEDVDIALKFLNHKNVTDYISEEGEELDTIKKNFYGSSILPPKLLRKIDLCVLTFLCFTYLLMFLDKALLNYAASMGIKKTFERG